MGKGRTERPAALEMCSGGCVSFLFVQKEEQANFGKELCEFQVQESNQAGKREGVFETGSDRLTKAHGDTNLGRQRSVEADFRASARDKSQRGREIVMNNCEKQNTLHRGTKGARSRGDLT
jgi:hypothetical protein